MSTEIEINRPAPITVSQGVSTFEKGDDVKEAINTLEAGNSIIIKDV